MKPTPSTLVLILLLGQLLVVLVDSNDFEFFFFVQNWPGSRCNIPKHCCYPLMPGSPIMIGTLQLTQKPASDFGIHGLWPNYRNGSSYPHDCSSTTFQESYVSNLIPTLEINWPKLTCPSTNSRELWSNQWKKHGTCSESVLNQHDYFDTALKLKQKVDLLQILQSKGIRPMNGQSHTISSIKNAIQGVTKFTPIIRCNIDRQGNKQLFEIWRCVTRDGSKFMECPKIPKAKLVDKEREECGKGDAQIHFPSFN